jgi:hypothetical protein
MRSSWTATKCAKERNVRAATTHQHIVTVSLNEIVKRLAAFRVGSWCCPAAWPTGR